MIPSQLFWILYARYPCVMLTNLFHIIINAPFTVQCF